jgi:hypothetical protein
MEYAMTTFREHLREQRWDDHRYYHHSLINQSLHFVSATTFLLAYLIVWRDPGVAGVGCGDDQPSGRAFLLRAARI